MIAYRLTVHAQLDLRRLLEYFREMGGTRSARKLSAELTLAFRQIARNPRIGHFREDLTPRPEVLFFPVRDVMIAYLPQFKPLTITLVARGDRDIAALLASRLQ